MSTLLCGVMWMNGFVRYVLSCQVDSFSTFRSGPSAAVIVFAQAVAAMYIMLLCTCRHPRAVAESVSNRLATSYYNEVEPKHPASSGSRT